MNAPVCFPDKKMFDEWKRLARHANEDSSPCDDCTMQYSQAMGLRCQRETVKVIFLVSGKTNYVKAKKDEREERLAKEEFRKRKATYDARRSLLNSKSKCR